MSPKSKTILFVILLFILFGSSVTYATLAPLTPPPPGGYDSGSNSILDPGCSPNTTDCFVNLPMGGGSITANNGLTAIGSNVQLGGTLLQNTNIDQNGNEFSITNNGTTFASGADPLNLFTAFGQAYPGIGMLTDGIATGGLQQWIAAINDGSDPITVVGNFDFANNIQGGLIVQGTDTQLSSSDGTSNSSVSVRNGNIGLSANDGIDIYANNYLRFNNFSSGRDDSGTNFPTNFLYTDGSGNLQSAPTSLLGGGGSSLSSQDEGTLLTSTTTGYNFIGAGVTATESGGLVTVNIPGGGGGSLTLQTNSTTNANQSLLNLVAGTNVSLADDGLGNVTVNASGGGAADGSIYANDGTLTGNRTLDGGGNDLGFTNLDGFAAIGSGGGLISFDREFSIQAKDDIVFIAGDLSAPDITDKMVFAPGGNLGSAGQILVNQGDGSVLWQTPAGGSTNIYNSDGTLAGNRTLDGGGNDLTFNNLSNFTLASSGTISSSTVSGSDSAINLMAPGGAALTAGKTDLGKVYSGGFSIIPGFGIAGGSTTRLYENNTTDGFYSSVVIDAEGGIGFDFDNSSLSNTYTFPRIDGSANQVLATDGAGQLSWHNGSAAAGALQLYSENPAAPYTSPVSTGLNSVAIGTGAQASADDMIVWGKNAGFGSLSSTQSTFLGANAGVGVSGASSINNTFIGANAGYTTSNLYDSIFIGSNTGFGSSNSHYSNFIGQSAGYGADNSDNSTFIGQYTGFRAIGASKSIFVGFTAGADSVNSYNTVAIGDSAGKGSQSQNSNFLGDSAGKQSTSTVNSNFFGSFAGSGSTTILDSVLMGSNAGSSSTNIRYSNLLGYYAGASSTKIYNSNFIGQYAGYSATNASNSIFIGTNSGSNDLVNNTTNPDDFSILLGNNTSTGGFSNSIALGSYATNTLSNQFMIGSTTRPIDETKIIGSLGTECTITTGTGMACTSDERLKTNITDLTSDTLTKLQNVRTVSYNWLQNPNSPTQIGFLAQNLEQYFPEMVMTDATGKKQVYYSQMTPILTKAIQELNLKVDMLSLNTGTNSNDVFGTLKNWLGDKKNGVMEIIADTLRARNQICIDDVCMSKDQLRALLQNQTNAPQDITTAVPVTPLVCNDPQIINSTGDACIDSADPVENNTDTELIPELIIEPLPEIQ